MYKDIPVVIVAGIGAKTRAVGKNNELLFHVPDDLKHFKKLTMGHPVIMGRKTFESIVRILGKALPGRTNIVVTRDTEYKQDGVIVAHSLEEAFASAAQENPKEIHIGGGPELWTQSFPYVDRLHLTLYDDDSDGDVYFPEYTEHFNESMRHGTREHNGLHYEWVDYVRN